MARKRTEVEAGSGNVFADLGYSDARERTLKVELAVEENGGRQARGPRLPRRARRPGSALVAYRLNRFSAERLMDFLTRLGKDDEIRIAPRPSGRRRSGVQVSHVEERASGSRL